jgi:RNA polymerase sigma-B factor
MTILTTSPVIVATAYPAETTTPPASHTGRDAPAVTTVANVAPSQTRFRRTQPADIDQTLTGQLLRQRDRLPAGHPDRAIIRARVIEANLPLAHHLARRYTGRGELLDDLVQVAALALVKAVDGYDPNRQTAFTSYAVPSILGALKRHFRDTAWGVRVPRSAQELAHAVATATAELSQQLGRSPTAADLADHLNVAVHDVVVAIDAVQSYHLTSLHTSHVGTHSANSGGGADLIDLVGDLDPRYARVDDHLLLRPLFAALPLRERRILTMRFFGDMSQAQIAAEIGVSQMHVSRLLTQSLVRLRAGMLC